MENCKVAALISIHGDPPPLCRFYITSPTLGPTSPGTKYELISLYECSHWAAFYFQFMLPRFEALMGESCPHKHPRNNQKMLGIEFNLTESCSGVCPTYRIIQIGPTGFDFVGSRNFVRTEMRFWIVNIC